MKWRFGMAYRTEPSHTPGLDTFGRRKAISHSLPTQFLLDVSMGTTNITLEVAKLLPSTRVVEIHPSPRMLSLACRKSPINQPHYAK